MSQGYVTAAPAQTAGGVCVTVREDRKRNLGTERGGVYSAISGTQMCEECDKRRKHQRE